MQQRRKPVDTVQMDPAFNDNVNEDDKDFIEGKYDLPDNEDETEPVSDIDSEVEVDVKEYAIEKIIDRRKGATEDEYRVRWEGFSEDDDTWLPFSSLSHSRGAVRDFNRDHQHAKHTLVNINSLEDFDSHQ